MNSRQGSLLALFFAACFLALQFNAVAETQFEQSDNQNFQIQVVSDSLIDNSFDNSAIYKLANTARSDCLSQPSSKRDQRQQFFDNNGQLGKQPFHHFMRQNFAAIRQDYQHQITTAFNNQLHLGLSFESNPLITKLHTQPPPEEPDQLIS